MAKAMKKHVVFKVHDTDRYQTDDYAINVSMQENVDKISIGIYITNYKVGVSGYQEYWHYRLDEKSDAKETYAKLHDTMSEVTEDFEHNNLPMSLLKPVVRRALDGIDVEHKERSGVSSYNTYITEVEKEADWRLSLYGHRYPGHFVHEMKSGWNVEEAPHRIDFDDVKNTRDRVVKYTYASANTKLAQAMKLKEMMEKLFGPISMAAFVAFLMAADMRGDSPETVMQQLQQNPEAVRAEIPEVEPDYVYQTPPVEETPQQTAFDNALSVTMGFEHNINDPSDDFVNVKGDPGGDTYKGVTRATYEQWLKEQGMPYKNVNMNPMPAEHVNAIYKEKFWDKVYGDKLPPVVAQQMFDYAVNSGPYRAVKELQRIVGSHPDGGFGPKTLAATNTYLQQHGDNELAQKLLDARRAYLTRLTQKNKKLQKFFRGWMNRLDKLQELIPTNAKPMVMLESPQFRDKQPPKSHIPPYQSAQTDVFASKKWTHIYNNSV